MLIGVDVRRCVFGNSHPRDRDRVQSRDQASNFRNASHDLAPLTHRKCINVDGEAGVDEALPGRHLGEVREPEPVRLIGLLLPADLIQRASRVLVAERRTHRLDANHAAQTTVFHQARHDASSHVDLLAS